MRVRGVGVSALADRVRGVVASLARGIGRIFGIRLQVVGCIIGVRLDVVRGILGIGFNIVGGLLARTLVAGGEGANAQCHGQNGELLHIHLPGKL